MSSSASRRNRRAAGKLTREQRAIMRITDALIDAADTARVKALIAAHKAALPDGWCSADTIMLAAQIVAAELALKAPNERSTLMAGLFSLTQNVLEQIDSRATQTTQ